MYLAIKSFEEIIIDQNLVNILIAIIKISFWLFAICLLIYVLCKFVLRDNMIYIFVKTLLWSVLLIFKLFFSGLAIAFVFFYDYKNHCWNAQHVYQITEMSLSSFFVGALAIIEVISTIENLINKIPAILKEIHENSEARYNLLFNNFHE